MSIDERLDRLTERHEALTQSVEMLLVAQRENEQQQRENEQQQRKNQKLLADIIGGIHDLARIARTHEDRITGLETGLS